MGIDAMSPPGSGLPARLVLGPALRAQSDGRLVRLVRDGYESAFEEIVRRYRRPLDRFAASIVGGRSEDVTQDSFRKALVALRGDEAEIELRPWLYRIVRNTALNDLRDRPPAAAELADDLMAGGRSAAAVAEERAEVAALTARMRALPEKQRAALVMRELEGMSHEQIAAALGVSSGAARQAIARARTAVRSGFGALVPLPLLRALASGGDPGTGAAVGAGGATAAGSVGGGAGGALGGVAASAGAGGLGGALKLGLATVVVAGSVGAGVAIEQPGGGQADAEKAASAAPGGPTSVGARSTPSPLIADVHRRSGSGDRGRSDDRSHGDGHGRDDGRHGRGRDGGHGPDGSLTGKTALDGGRGPSHSGGPGPSSTSGGPGPSRHGGRADDSTSGHDGSGGDGSGDDHSGSRHGSSGGDGGGSGESGGSRHGSGDGGPSGGGRDGSGDSRSGGGDSGRTGSGDGHGGSTGDGGSGTTSGSNSSGSTDGGGGSDDAPESV
ncbi:MAG TPA: RNA polymerase sigma factor, partial [Solirubrobacterales bacterium]